MNPSPFDTTPRAFFARRAPLSMWAGVFCVVYAALVALRKVENFDVWWHLKMGETILQGGTIPLSDLFSHTMAGQPWMPHEWLAQVVLALANRLGDTPGLSLLTAGVLALCGLGLYIRSRALGASPWITALICVWVMLAARFRFMPRPHIFFFLVATALLLLLEDSVARAGDRPGTSAPRKRVWLVVPLMLAWVNAHGSFPLGIFFLGTWGIAGWLRTRSPIYPSVVLCGAAITVFNPGGIHILDPMIDVFRFGSTTPLGRNEEFLPPRFGDYRLFWAYLVMLAATIAATARRELPGFLEVAVILTTLALALTAVRFIAPFLLLTAPYAARRATFALEPVHSAFGKRFPRLFPWLPAILTLVMAVAGFSHTYGPGKAYRWGPGLDERTVPKGAVRFLADSRLQDIRLYNAKRFGGYLTWRLFPRFRTSMDGRDELFAPLLAALERCNPATYRNLLDRYHFQIAVTAFVPENAFENLLAADPNWVLVYWDDLSIVRARRDAVPTEFVQRYAFRYINPATLDYSFLAKPVREGRAPAVLEEIRRVIAADPKAFKPWVYLGFVEELSGRTTEAIAAYRRALANNPLLGWGHYGLGIPLGRLLLAKGDTTAALDVLAQHLDTHGRTGEALYLYGAALSQAKRLVEAEETLTAYLTEKPDDARALADLGFLMLDGNRLDEADRFFSQARLTAPDGPGLYGKAMVLQKRGDCAAAIPLWKKIGDSTTTAPRWRDKARAYLAACAAAGPR